MSVFTLRITAVQNRQPRFFFLKWNFGGSPSAPSISIFKVWFTDFCFVLRSTNGAERFGRPIKVSSTENVEKIGDMMLIDQRVKLREIFDANSCQ